MAIRPTPGDAERLSRRPSLPGAGLGFRFSRGGVPQPPVAASGGEPCLGAKAGLQGDRQGHRGGCHPHRALGDGKGGRRALREAAGRSLSRRLRYAAGREECRGRGSEESAPAVREVLAGAPRCGGEGSVCALPARGQRGLMQNGMSKWKLLTLIASFWVVADQATKYLAVEHLTAAFLVARARTFPEKLGAFVTQKDLLERGLASPIPVTVTPFWQHRYTQNRGAAWGVLSGAGEQFRVPFFYLVSIAAVIFIFSYYRKLRTDQRYLQLALALVLGVADGAAAHQRERELEVAPWIGCCAAT